MTNNKLDFIKATMGVLGLNNRFNLNSLFDQVKTDGNLEKLVNTWYDVKHDDGLAKMILNEIEFYHDVASKNITQ